LAKHPLDSDYWTAYYIIAFSLIGSISMIIKSNFGACLDALFMDLDDRNEDNENHQDIQIINTEHNSQTLFDQMIDHLKMKLTLLKNCLRYGPVLTFNVLLALMIIPYELSIAKSGVTYCLENCSQHWITAQQKKMRINFLNALSKLMRASDLTAVAVGSDPVPFPVDVVPSQVDAVPFRVDVDHFPDDSVLDFQVVPAYFPVQVLVGSRTVAGDAETFGSTCFTSGSWNH